jgi:hypothetical protein
MASLCGTHEIILGIGDSTRIAVCGENSRSYAVIIFAIPGNHFRLGSLIVVGSFGHLGFQLTASYCILKLPS